MYFNFVAAIVGVLGTLVSLYLLYVFSISDNGHLQIARYFALATVSFIIIGITEILELLFPSVEKFLIQINFIAALFVLCAALAALRIFGVEASNTPIFFGRFGMSILYISVLFLAANEVRGSEVA